MPVECGGGHYQYEHNIDDYYENDEDFENPPKIGDIVKLNNVDTKVVSINKAYTGIELTITNDLLDNKLFDESYTVNVNPYQVEYVMSKKEFELKNKIKDF